MFIRRVLRGCQFSVRWSSVELEVQSWVTTLPANFWTLSRLAMSCLRWGSQTQQQYSSLGWMVELTIFLHTSSGAWCSCLWIRPNCLLEDLQTALTWSDHVRLAERVTPRYFTQGLGRISTPFTLRLVGMGCLDLVILRSLVFAWLGMSPWEEIHWRMESTSFCRRMLSSAVLIGL